MVEAERERRPFCATPASRTRDAQLLLRRVRRLALAHRRCRVPRERAADRRPPPLLRAVAKLADGRQVLHGPDPRRGARAGATAHRRWRTR